VAEQHFAAVTMEEWAAVCRDITAVKEDISTARDGQHHGKNYNQHP